MSLSWEWTDEIGTLTVADTLEDETTEWTFNIYQGNALAIFVYEYEVKTNDTPTAMYALQDFWVDESHAKKMLGITKGADGIKENHEDSGARRWKHLELNASHPATPKLLALVAKAKWAEDLEIVIKAS